MKPKKPITTSSPALTTALAEIERLKAEATQMHIDARDAQVLIDRLRADAARHETRIERAFRKLTGG